MKLLYWIRCHLPCVVRFLDSTLRPNWKHISAITAHYNKVQDTKRNNTAGNNDSITHGMLSMFKSRKHEKENQTKQNHSRALKTNSSMKQKKQQQKKKWARGERKLTEKILQPSVGIDIRIHLDQQMHSRHMIYQCLRVSADWEYGLLHPSVLADMLLFGSKLTLYNYRSPPLH